MPQLVAVLARCEVSNLGLSYNPAVVIEAGEWSAGPAPESAAMAGPPSDNCAFSTYLRAREALRAPPPPLG